MTDTFRALCVDLAERLEWYIREDDVLEGGEWADKNAYWIKGRDDAQEDLDRAQAALSQEGDGVGVTEAELIAFARNQSPWREWMEPDGSLANAHFELAELLRAAISRFGSHPQAPIPVAERPWEREGFCDVEGQCWWWDSIAQVWTYLNREQAERAGYYTYACPAAAIPLPEASL